MNTLIYAYAMCLYVPRGWGYCIPVHLRTRVPGVLRWGHDTEAGIPRGVRRSSHSPLRPLRDRLGTTRGRRMVARSRRAGVDAQGRPPESFRAGQEDIRPMGTQVRLHARDPPPRERPADLGA